MDNSKDTFGSLQKKIELAESRNEPITDYVKQQIELLETAHDEFIKEATNAGFPMNNLKVGEIEIGQYSAMETLAKKIGLPHEKYAELIKQVRIRILGEENVGRFFGDE